MQPQLEAREALQTAQRVGVGTGSVRKHEGQATVRRWEREASGRATGQRAKATPDALAAMGIGVTRVRKAHGR